MDRLCSGIQGNLARDMLDLRICHQYSLVFMTGLPMGRIFDRGHLKVPVAIASACLIVATFLIAECTEYYQFLLCQGFVVGVSQELLYEPFIRTNNEYEVDLWGHHRPVLECRVAMVHYEEELRNIRCNVRGESWRHSIPHRR